MPLCHSAVEWVFHFIHDTPDWCTLLLSPVHACSETSKDVLKKCSACKMVMYCSKEHQAADWPAHKDGKRPSTWHGGSGRPSTWHGGSGRPIPSLPCQLGLYHPCHVTYGPLPSPLSHCHSSDAPCPTKPTRSPILPCSAVRPFPYCPPGPAECKVFQRVRVHATFYTDEDMLQRYPLQPLGCCRRYEDREEVPVPPGSSCALCGKTDKQDT
jgi:hypothetical protein